MTRWRPRALPRWCTQDMQAALVRRAEDGMPHEVCGLILASGRVLSLPNVHSDPINNFRMDPDATIKALMLANGGKPLAIWHSHPRGSTIPSRPDAIMANLTRMPLLIATLSGVHYWSVAQCEGWLGYEAPQVG